MKTKFFSIFLLSFFSFSASATLLDQGNGMIYDDVLEVTWLQNANYANSSGYVTPNGRDVTSTNGRMNWNEAVEWADQLSYGGFSQWRLPTVEPINGTNFVVDVSFDGSTDFGEHITSPQSELSYMYFANLNNPSVHDSVFGCGPIASSSCLNNTGSFNNLESYNYWSGTEVESDTFFAWSFNTQHGIQTLYDGKPNEFYAWAVHQGDITTVPIPSAFWLFGCAFIGLFRLKTNIR